MDGETDRPLLHHEQTVRSVHETSNRFMGRRKHEQMTALRIIFKFKDIKLRHQYNSDVTYEEDLNECALAILQIAVQLTPWTPFFLRSRQQLHVKVPAFMETHGSPPLVPAPRQVNPVYTQSSLIFLTFHLCLGLSSSLLQVLPLKFCTHFFSLPSMPNHNINR